MGGRREISNVEELAAFNRVVVQFFRREMSGTLTMLQLAVEEGLEMMEADLLRAAKSGGPDPDHGYGRYGFTFAMANLWLSTVEETNRWASDGMESGLEQVGNKARDLAVSSVLALMSAAITKAVNEVVE